MKQKIFRTIADLRFSICILLVISSLSILGTIIEQDQSIESYQRNYPIIHPVWGFLTWDRILYFGLDHVYRTWWFFLFLVLFGSSLVSCTFLQQLPSFKIARRCQFLRTTQPFQRLKISTILTTFSFPNLFRKLQIQNYSLFQQKNLLYGYQGVSGRVAPILVHLSMILILVGTIVGSLLGFQAQEIVPKTETFHLQNVLKTGYLTNIPHFSARINDFWITYTNQKTVSQFYSDLSILSQKGNELDRKTLFVNSPLIYDGVYYYQTDWNLIGLRFYLDNNENMEYPLIPWLSNANKIWLTWIPTNSLFQNGLIVMMDNLEGYASLYSETGKFLGNLEVNEKTFLPSKLTFLEIVSSTGLQIKKDTGIPIIYTGFGLLMLSTFLTYLTYSQIWMLQTDKKVLLGGTTQRATYEFELDFLKLIQ